MCYIYQYLEGTGQVVNTVQVQRGEYEQLTSCFKYCNCERRFTQGIGGDLAKEKRERKKEMTQTNCNQRGSVTSECSVPYLCSFWILQKMACSSTDVGLCSSQGETDQGRIVRDPESILVSGAASTALLLRQPRQE